MGGFVRRVTSGVTVGMVTAIVTTAIVAGGLAFAAGVESVPNNSVNSAKIVNGTVKGIDIKNGTVAAIDLAPALRPRWATFDIDGVDVFLHSSRGDTPDAQSTAIGVYEVDFTASVDGCAYFVTRQEGASIPAPGEITADRATGDLTMVVVRSYDSTGAPADLTGQFALQVLC